MTEQTFDQAKTENFIEENISFADYMERYDGQNTEWHAGKVVQKVTNNTDHNFIQMFLSRLLLWYLETTSTGELLAAGIPMYISDDVPAREPDIMLVLNEHKNRITKKHLNGIADLVVEIVSPGTGHVDRGAKFDEYEAAAIPEYWIIDPIRKSADIYALNEEGHYQRIKGTDEKIISKLLPNFILDTVILWQEELPKGREIVQLVENMVKD